MKKYITLSICTCILFLTAWSIPKCISAQIPQAEIVSLTYDTYIETVKADGVIEETEKTDLLLDIPIVPDEVYVEVGDYVEAGDLIATVDANQTITALANTQSALSDSGALEAILAGSSIDSITEEIPEQIISTASGVVTSLSLQRGSLTPLGSSAMTISNTDKLKVTVSVDEDDIPKVETGQTVSITGTALGENKYYGIVSKIYPAASTKVDGLTSKTVLKVDVTLDNYDDEFRPGYNVTAKINVSDEIETIIMPYSCIGQLDDGREYVFCYENGKAVMREITIGRETNKGAEILDGLNADDIVLSPASSILGNNSFVRIKE